MHGYFTGNVVKCSIVLQGMLLSILSIFENGFVGFKNNRSLKLSSTCASGSQCTSDRHCSPFCKSPEVAVFLPSVSKNAVKCFTGFRKCHHRLILRKMLIKFWNCFGKVLKKFWKSFENFLKILEKLGRIFEKF